MWLRTHDGIHAQQRVAVKRADTVLWRRSGCSRAIARYPSTNIMLSKVVIVSHIPLAGTEINSRNIFCRIMDIHPLKVPLWVRCQHLVNQKGTEENNPDIDE
jgi:hypothetical protein